MPRHAPPPPRSPQLPPSLPSIPATDLTVGAVLATGGYGLVHAGTWLGAPVAVKSLTLAAGDVGDAPARAFEREVAALARLRHPNIIPVYGVVRHNDRLSLVEELATGGSLQARLHGPAAAARLSLAEAARIGAEVARALAHAHREGVAHNDVKPANILFNAAGAAVLCDFGLVKCVHSALPSTMRRLLGESLAGAGALGTLNYTAPESLDEESAHYGQPPADVYALGLVLAELAGAPEAWRGRGMMQIAQAVRAGRRPPLPQGVEPRLAALIERCWAQDPLARPSAGAVAAELGELQGVAASTATVGAPRARCPSDAGPAGCGAAGLLSLPAIGPPRLRCLSDAGPGDGPLSVSSAGGGGGGGGGGDCTAAAATANLPSEDLGAAHIVELMRANTSSSATQSAGALALRGLAAREGGVAQCLDAGALPALTAALALHGAADACAPEAARSLLRALAALSACDTGAAACEAAAEAALPAITAALRAHAARADAALYAARALGGLAASARGKAAALACGAVPALLAALHAHCADGDVAQYTCWALTRLAASSAGQEACVAARAVPSLAAALRAHAARTPCVAQYACRALANIAACAAGKAACVAAPEAVAAVVAALRAQPGCTGVAQHACWALTNVAATSEGQDACVAAGAAPAVVAALAAALGSGSSSSSGSSSADAPAQEVAHYASWALLNMAWGSAAHREAVTAAGAVPLLAAVAAAHGGEARRRALAALDRLGCTEAGEKKADGTGIA